MRFSIGEEARLLFGRTPSSQPFVGCVGIVSAIGPYKKGDLVIAPPMHGVCMARGDYLFVLLDDSRPGGAYIMTALDGQLMKLGDPDAGIEIHEAKELTA